MKTPGDRLRDLRNAAGLTQSQAAAVLGLAQGGTFGSWERNETVPRVSQIRALAEATASTVEDVRSWLETGEPELVWKAGKPGQPPAPTAPASTGQDPTGTDEGERAIAYWFWRYRLSEAERGEAIRQFRVAVTRSAPGRPKGWEETTGRSGGE